MITAEGCRMRRQRLLDGLRPTEPLLLADPIHLRYFAGCYVDPFSLGADFGGVLRIAPDGRTTLFHDNRLPKSVELAHVDERTPVLWYNGQQPGHGPRRVILRAAIDAAGGRIHDSLDDPLAPALYNLVHDLRRKKDPDEIETLRTCMRATEAGHAWAREHAKPGMMELEVYNGIFSACTLAAGQPVIVYGDFTVSPGSAKRGGMATKHILQPGETLILDYSVVMQGYRSDFTNTLVIGAEPTADQRRIFDLCVAAMTAGEKMLRAGVTCLDVYNAVRGVFEHADVADSFPHHAGHGLGLSHPEAPFLVREANETLIEGDVITLEPGLYIDDIGGVRIEHNYAITAGGYDRLSNHTIALR